MDAIILNKIQHIHQLSQLYNQKVGVNHHARLLDLIKQHVIEIEALFQKKDEHALTETGDLLILCFELLLEHNQSIDAVIERCIGRYERKLSDLIDESDVSKKK